jgi:hypothetical protein
MELPEAVHLCFKIDVFLEDYVINYTSEIRCLGRGKIVCQIIIGE